MLARLRFALVPVLAAIAAAALSASALAQKTTVTFLHTNDVYEISPVRGWGGFAELMTLLRKERAAARNSLTTLGGDLISPSLMSGLTKGTQMIELMNAIGLELAVFGNHEFDFGDDVLKSRMAESRFTWFATNVVGADGKPFNGAASTIIREIDGFKFGFFGLLTPETATLSSPGKDIKFLPIVETAAAAVKALKDQGAEVIVAITHLSIAEDRTVARRVPGIDLILGGHDHDPITYRDGATLIHKAGYDAHHLAVVELAVTRTQTSAGPRIGVVPAWRMLAVNAVAPDPEIAAVVKKHNDRLDAELNVKIGVAATALDSRRASVRAKESAIGNLIADATREAVGAEVGLANGGGIRGDKTYEAGHQLTRKDILTELPFGNLTVLIELKGSDLKAALEHSVSRVAELQGRFLQISGASMVYDPNLPPGSRVLEVNVGGAPLDPNKTYKVATNEYIYGGGDGFETLKNGKSLIDPSGAKLLASQVIDYIAAKGTVAPQIEGRIVAK
ncbi:MAG: bifunctional metallophosphatase/5'-nucleotidase [Pseudomonadota bacterium]